uniref:MFS transporter n=1 Tax=Stappia sp. TaxID=1870903 RepID=UPI003BAB6925
MTPPRSAPPLAKALALSLLATAVIAALSLWFVSAAILPEMLAERAISPMRQALLSSGVQIGFVAGALASAVLGLPDRLHPGRLFALCAALAGAINATLIVVPVGSGTAIVARIATGALLAGVYPVGMKIAVGWGLRDRGFLVGILVGAVTIGSAVPHLFALGGGTDWRLTVSLASLAALFAAVLALFVGLGPHHATARRFDPTVVGEAWRNRRIRLAFLGYFGHMWELYAMWTWAGAALGASFATLMPEADALFGARLLTFLAVALGGIGCIAGGYVADRIGKETVAIIALSGSLASAVFCAFAFGGPPVIVAAAFLFWGLTIAPDSPQFSALVADFAAPRHAGSIMTLQTALGFALTFVTVQATPVLAGLLGWQAMILLLAAGPALGLVAMVRLRRLMRSQEDG